MDSSMRRLHQPELCPILPVLRSERPSPKHGEEDELLPRPRSWLLPASPRTAGHPTQYLCDVGRGRR